MADSIWRYREAIRTGWLLYISDNPVRIHLTTEAPRIVLQCIFFTLAGRILNGHAGSEYAFTGCIAYAACTKTVVGLCDITMTDEWSGTYHRLQVAALPPWLTYLCRTPPYIASGILYSLLVLAVDGPILGLTGQSLSLIPLLPIYLLTAFTSAAFGLAVAGLAVGRSADILLGNLAAYIILATGGIVVPQTASTRWLAELGYGFPLQHGLAAIHAHLLGHPWGGQAALEAGVGTCWIAIAILQITVRDRRSRAAFPGRRFRQVIMAPGIRTIAFRHGLPGRRAGARLRNQARYSALDYAIGLAAAGTRFRYPQAPVANCCEMVTTASIGKPGSASRPYS